MRIITSVEDFRACRDLSQSVGKWQAWLDGYYPKYKHAFDWMLRFLYLADLDSLRGPVEDLDFDRALTKADAFLAAGGGERVRSLIEATERVLHPDFAYDALLMIGLGHVNGTVIPEPAPAIYLGLETRELTDQLEMVVPHEFNHLIRLRGLLSQGVSLRTLDSFGDRVIAEGLATVTPPVVSGTPLVGDALAKALMMPHALFDWCEAHWPELWRDISAEWDQPANQRLMREFLVGSDTGWIDGRAARSGYYIGTRLIADLLRRGHELPELTLLPANQISALLQD